MFELIWLSKIIGVSSMNKNSWKRILL